VSIFACYRRILIDITFHSLSTSWLEYSESDYAVITREFEDHVDDKILEAVKSAASADAVGSVLATTTAEGNS
jgi:hypothetical protein